MERHPGISIHRIAVGGGIMGAVFGVGVCVIFLVGVVEVRWFLLMSLALGVAIAALLHFVHGRKPVEVTGADDETRLKLD